MLPEEMADNTGFKDCFAGDGTSFMMILLIADSVAPLLRAGTIPARSDRRAMREQRAPQRAPLKVEMSDSTWPCRLWPGCKSLSLSGPSPRAGDLEVEVMPPEPRGSLPNIPQSGR